MRRFLSVLMAFGILMSMASTSLAMPSKGSPQTARPMSADPAVIEKALKQIKLDNVAKPRERITFTDGSYIEATLTVDSAPAPHGVTSNVVTPQAVTYRTAWGSVGGYNIYGGQVWALDVRAQWGFDYTSVTYYQDPPAVQTYTYVPNVYSSSPFSQSSRLDAANVKFYGSAKFEEIVSGIIIQSTTAWVDMTAHANGTVSGTWGGGSQGAITAY